MTYHLSFHIRLAIGQEIQWKGTNFNLILYDLSARIFPVCNTGISMAQNNLLVAAVVGVGAINTVSKYNQQQYLEENGENILSLKRSIATLSAADSTDISSVEGKRSDTKLKQTHVIENITKYLSHLLK